MTSFRYGNLFAQASSQFCRHMDEYLVADTRGLVYFQIFCFRDQRQHSMCGFCVFSMISATAATTVQRDG